MFKFKGTGVALITPFHADFSVDYESLTRLINFQIEQGVDYLVALGSTAEAATLTGEEKKQIALHFVSVNKGRVPLVIGIGGNYTQAVAQEIQNTDLTGFDAILSVSPSYNKPSQEGIYQHFKVLSAVSPLPIILYNVPGRTSKNMEPVTVIRLANDFENIIAIKEAAGDLVQSMELIRTKPSNFEIISGDDLMALPMTLAGGVGVISVIGQGFPKEFSTMIRLGLAGHVSESYKIHYGLMPIIDLIFKEGNPTGIKALLSQMKYCSNLLRLPLVSSTEKLNQGINEYFKNNNQIK